jgi:hypothetical protein
MAENLADNGGSPIEKGITFYGCRECCRGDEPDAVVRIAGDKVCIVRTHNHNIDSQVREVSLGSRKVKK